MTVLILILGQIIFLAFALKIIFSLIDKLILVYRRKTYHPDRLMLMEETLKARRARKEKQERLSRIERKSLSPTNSTSWQQLLSRVNFDIATAERLVDNLKTKHPGKTDRWYIEKAINDLDRDRN